MLDTKLDFSPSPRFDNDKTMVSIPEWEKFGSEESRFSASELSRHYFILGETGSGKTLSGILPLLNALIGVKFSNESKEPFILVIDPKHEIIDFVKKHKSTSDRLVEFSLSKDDYKIDFFEGHDRSIISAEDVVDRVRDIFFEQSLDDKDKFWENQAVNIIKAIVQIDIDLHRKGVEFWNAYTNCAKSKVKTKEFFSDRDSGWTMSAEEFYNICRNRIKEKTDIDNYFLRIQRFVGLVNIHRTAAFSILETLIRENSLSTSYIDEMAPFSTMGLSTFGSISSFVNKSINKLSSPEVNRHIWFYPFKTTDKSIGIDNLMSAGKILIFHPDQASVGIGSIVGKCIKSKIFETVFYRSDKQRPVIYVCDEFQRFVTNDPISGEQSFLDRCRAYRTICILATQSIASLAYALSRSGNLATTTSIDIIMTNTGNKLFFRSTDVMVMNKLRELIPSPSLPDKKHILEVRPPATLTVGECYYVFSSGLWGRKRVNIDNISI